MSWNVIASMKSKQTERRMADSDSDSCSSSGDSCSNSSDKRETQSSSEPRNIFKNDGSFLKMFQLLQQEGKQTNDVEPPAVRTPIAEPSPPASSTSPPPSLPTPTSSCSPTEVTAKEKDRARKKSVLGIVGKRRGGKVLPTGMVKKQRKDDPVKGGGSPKDAWSQYMEEVRKYKELSCEGEGKTRPLVK